MKKIILLGLFIITTSLSSYVFAQKYGHLNTAELIQVMPGYVSATNQLQKKRDELQKNLTDLNDEYRTLLEDYNNQLNNGNLQDAEKKEKEKKLIEFQTKINNYQQYAREEIGKLENQLLTPVISKARAAISEVAAENGFTYIFDTNAQSLIYTSTSSNDILPLVKKKLGLE